MSKIKLNKNQKLIAERRYLKTDDEGKPVENTEQMFKRIAKYIASAEKKYDTPDRKIKKLEEKFFKIFSNFEFISGIALNDRGRERLMGDCYVLPLKDSLKSIYKTLYQSVQLHRLGAGIGYDFSPLRPEGSEVKTTGKESSGPISFMRLFDFSSEIILNRGSARHAGHMGILRIDHPDIEQFVTAKTDHTQLTNFNLSVAITDGFMDALEKDKKIELINPQNNNVVKKIEAKKILDMISESIYKSGEPGVVFIDEINREHTLKNGHKITATNLCGEQPLLPYESCNLGSPVLPNFVSDGKIKWSRLEEVIRVATRYMDNTLDVCFYPLKESRKIMLEDNRKIGIGVMGWADMLAKLDIPYDSEQALKLAEKLMKFIRLTARDESAKIGKEKGSFTNFGESIFANSKYKHMRNATVTTIAPTGTISLFSDCNGGIEPFFALAYKRKNMKTLGETEMIYTNKYLEEKLKKEWLYSKDLMKKVVKKGSIQSIEKIPQDIKEIFKTSYDIDPIWHLKMQAAFQKHTDNAVSKTINLPKGTTIKKIKEILKNANKLKLKGITIYRDKSRDKQVLTRK